MASEFLAGFCTAYKAMVYIPTSATASMLRKEIVLRSATSKRYETGACVGATFGMASVFTMVPIVVAGAVVTTKAATNAIKSLLRK